MTSRMGKLTRISKTLPGIPNYDMADAFQDNLKLSTRLKMQQAANSKIVQDELKKHEEGKDTPPLNKRNTEPPEQSGGFLLLDITAILYLVINIAK